MSQVDLDCVFVGTMINATYLKGILKQNGINCIIRDFLNESSIAGYAAASTENAAKVFVDELDFERAEEIVFSLFDDV